MRSASSCPRLSSRLQSHTSLGSTLPREPWSRAQRYRPSASISSRTGSGTRWRIGRPAATRPRIIEDEMSTCGISMRSMSASASTSGETPGRRATAMRASCGHELGLVPGRERRVLVGAEQQHERRCRDSAAPARAACRPCTRGPGARSRRARPSAPGCRSPPPARGAGAWPPTPRARAGAAASRSARARRARARAARSPPGRAAGARGARGCRAIRARRRAVSPCSPFEIVRLVVGECRARLSPRAAARTRSARRRSPPRARA